MRVASSPRVVCPLSSHGKRTGGLMISTSLDSYPRVCCIRSTEGSSRLLDDRDRDREQGVAATHIIRYERSPAAVGPVALHMCTRQPPVQHKNYSSEGSVEGRSHLLARRRRRPRAGRGRRAVIRYERSPADAVGPVEMHAHACEPPARCKRYMSTGSTVGDLVFSMTATTTRRASPRAS